MYYSTSRWSLVKETIVILCILCGNKCITLDCTSSSSSPYHLSLPLLPSSVAKEYIDIDQSSKSETGITSGGGVAPVGGAVGGAGRRRKLRRIENGLVTIPYQYNPIHNVHTYSLVVVQGLLVVYQLVLGKD